jgi:hypothetical protein
MTRQEGLMVRLARVFLRTAVLGGAVLASLASDSPQGGDRTDGECPAGETCSPATPEGVYFGGAVLGDDPVNRVVEPWRTAVGGVQTLAMFTDEHADHPFVGFTALSAGPSFAVTSTAGNLVAIQGLKTGTDFLRLVDASKDPAELYDRVALQVAAIDQLAIVPMQTDLASDKELYQTVRPALVYSTKRVDARYVIALYDSSDVRLVDESLGVTLGNGFTRDLDRWDRFRQTAVLPPGTYNFQVALGSGDSGTVSLTFVERADAVKWVAGTGADQQVAPSEGVRQGRSLTYCFRAENAGRPMLGETFVYSVSGGIVLADPAADSNCVTVTGKTVGSATLSVLAGDASLSLDVPVKAAKALEGTPLPAAPADHAVDSPVGGERALSAAPY